MKHEANGSGLADCDATDLHILDLLQRNCRQPMAAIGAEVGLTAPSVVERIHKLEEAGVIRGYSALVDGRRRTWYGPNGRHPLGVGHHPVHQPPVQRLLGVHEVAGQRDVTSTRPSETTRTVSSWPIRLTADFGMRSTVRIPVVKRSRPKFPTCRDCPGRLAYIGELGPMTESVPIHLTTQASKGG